MKVVNATNHPIRFFLENSVLTLKPSGWEPRVQQIREQTGSVKTNGTEIPETVSTFGRLQGLPPEESGTIYIVSAITCKAAASIRSDFRFPDDLVRDEKGFILGCRSLGKIV